MYCVLRRKRKVTYSMKLNAASSCIVNLQLTLFKSEVILNT